METLTPFTPTFILEHARRLGIIDPNGSDGDAELESERTPSPKQAGSPKPARVSTLIPAGVPEHCVVRDLDTGAVFHAEKEGKLLLKQYQVADPAKLLSRLALTYIIRLYDR
jgi:hypothetical protein